MKTVPRKCYECGAKIPTLTSRLRTTQEFFGGFTYKILEVVTKCPHGHKNSVEVFDPDGV